MIRTKLQCPHCEKLISKSNFNKHILSHQNNPKYQKSLLNRQSLNHTGLNCQYCGKLCKSKGSLAQHEIRCNQNPNKIINYTNGMLGKKSWNHGLNKETDERIAKGAKTYHQNHLLGKHDYSHNKHSEETKEKIRKQKLELCAKQGTNLCGKGKRGYYKGYYCQSSWELAYVIYCLEHNIEVKRNKERFKYILEGIERSYFPDFILKDGTYVEIKGYYDNKTKEKEKQFPKDKKLIILQEKEMSPILEYVKNKYGNNFIELYNIV